MRIPSKLFIAGMVIETIVDEGMSKREGLVGQADHNKMSIRIDPSEVSENVLGQSYVHEAIHIVFHIMGRPDLRDDEVFVDLLSHLVYQAIASCETDRNIPLKRATSPERDKEVK
jgi:hypothetical protein